MTVQDRITLKNFKHAQFASEETLCFEATVCFDGKAFATAGNDGQGGDTVISRLYDRKQQQYRPDTEQIMAQAVAYAHTLPDEVTQWDDPQGPTGKLTIKQTLVTVVDALSEEAGDDKRLRGIFRRAMNARVLFVKNGQMMSTRSTNRKMDANFRATER